MPDKLYKIPAINFPRLEEEIARLNKRAVKLKCEPIKLTIVRTTTEKRIDESLKFEYDFVVHECSLEGERPMLQGWSLVAVVQPVPNGEMLIREVPGCTCPDQYRTTDMRCEQCNVVRRRTAIFILHNNAQGHKQVGRNCLSDFLGGVAPEALLNRAEIFFGFDELLKQAEDATCGSRWGSGDGSPVLPIEQYVSVVAALSRKYGYVSKARASEMKEPTSSVAWRICMPYAQTQQEMLAAYAISVESQDVEKARAAIAWACSLDPKNADNNYLHDLGVSCRQQFVQYKTVGYIASVLQAHNRHLLTLNPAPKIEQPQPISKHLGVIGERQVFEKLLITGVFPYESGDFEKTRVHFLDEAGNVLIWRASGTPQWVAENKTVTIRATVKHHDEFRGVNQTVIERALPLEDSL